MADYNSAYTGAQIDAAIAAVRGSTVVAASCTGNAATATSATTSGACSGNAATATKLATARTIDGISFDGTAAIATRLRFTNTSVAVSAWVADSTYADYPFRAAVPLSGVTAAMTPEVALACTDAVSGSFAPVAACYAGGVYLYAAEVPAAAITIPTITCWK